MLRRVGHAAKPLDIVSGSVHLGCPRSHIGRLWNIRRAASSLRFEARKLHDLAPLFSFLGDDFAERGGSARKWHATQVDKPRLDLGIGEGRVDLSVEPFDDLGRRVPRSTNAGPSARLVVWHKLT